MKAFISPASLPCSPPMHSFLFPPLKAGTLQGTEAVVGITMTARIRKQFDSGRCRMPVLVELFLETWEDQALHLEKGCWGGSVGMVHWWCMSQHCLPVPWINPPASWLIPDHGPSFNTAGVHCTCKYPPSLPCHSLLHLLWLSSSWG